MGGVRSDKARDASDGYDGGWVAHPGLVPIAMEEFVKVLGDKPNQIAKQREDVQVTQQPICSISVPKIRSPKAACAAISTWASTILVRGWRAMAACRSTT
jgi:malate synthase